MNDEQPTPPKQQVSPAVIRYIQLSGYGFILVGILGFLQPQLLEEFLGLDRETAMIFSGAMVFVGFSDLVVVPMVLRQAGDRDKK